MTNAQKTNGFEKSNTGHIVHPVAQALIKGLRDVNCGLTKVYGSRYLQALANECGYRTFPKLIEGKVKQVLIVRGTEQLKDSPKDAALYMERTLDSWCQLGIKS